MKIFIGSSSEQYPVVKEIKRDLNDLMRGTPLRLLIGKHGLVAENSIISLLGMLSRTH